MPIHYEIFVPLPLGSPFFKKKPDTALRSAWFKGYICLTLPWVCEYVALLGPPCTYFFFAADCCFYTSANVLLKTFFFVGLLFLGTTLKDFQPALLTLQQLRWVKNISKKFPHRGL